jgi:hypothetical protein
MLRVELQSNGAFNVTEYHSNGRPKLNLRLGRQIA